MPAGVAGEAGEDDEADDNDAADDGDENELMVLDPSHVSTLSTVTAIIWLHGCLFVCLTQSAFDATGSSCTKGSAD